MNKCYIHTRNKKRLGPMSRREAEALLRQGLVADGVIVEEDTPAPDSPPLAHKDKAGEEKLPATSPILAREEKPRREEPVPAASVSPDEDDDDELVFVPDEEDDDELVLDVDDEPPFEADEEEEKRDGCWMVFFKSFFKFLLIGGIYFAIKYWVNH